MMKTMRVRMDRQSLMRLMSGGGGRSSAFMVDAAKFVFWRGC